ncbi:24-dehydrocholesterol reductase-like protein precursor [Lophiotrema nucula]|uniref:Delta(24)-sterol reductase n=1 Tax=Lophiotrema nucula TaxID=690887 RepID=A0A6A5Z6P8_9PLEO|nr:24-dehydrocholesterol reductase-like protein precursor [Lophiotrema nucula]
MAYTPHDHDIAVQKLSNEVKTLHESKTPFRINHGSTNSTRVRAAGTPELNIAHLNNIISVDKYSKSAIVEPNVPLDKLVPATLKQGLLPPVVMEFPGITVGGGFSGASAESSSWREGLFDCSITSIEVILGNGETVRAEKGGDNADLFSMARCALGTLGVVTLLTVRLIEAKDFVEVTYHRTTSVKSTIDKVAELCEGEYEKETKMGQGGFDFIEGIQFSTTHGVVTTGRLAASASKPNTRVQRFDRGKDPWFYQHARGITADSGANTHVELVPTTSYLFRHDRGAFWSGDTFFSTFAIPNNAFFRWFFNPALTTRAVYKNMHANGGPETNIVQDLIIPKATAEEFANYVIDELGIWPLWVCPIGGKDQLRKHKLSKKEDLFINFGVWGTGPDSPPEFRRVNRRMESVLNRLRGMKVLYAYSFYTEDEFWSIYDKQRYLDARKKYHAEALPDIYEKVRRRESPAPVEEKDKPLGQRVLERLFKIWPFGGLIVGAMAWWGKFGE